MTTKALTPEQLIARLNIVIRNQSVADVLPAAMALVSSLAEIASRHPATTEYMQTHLKLALARLQHTDPTT